MYHQTSPRIRDVQGIRPRTRWPALILLVAVALLSMRPAQAEPTFEVYLGSQLGAPWSEIPVVPLVDLPFKYVVPQRYDTSCGAAALATLLTEHYGIPIREEQIFAEMWDSGDKQRIIDVGFSLLDLKKYLKESKNLASNGFRVDLERLERLGVAGVVLIDEEDLTHFVVLSGFKGDQVLLADPALGMRVMSRDRFLEVWNGIFFAVTERKRTAQASFGAPRFWSTTRQAPTSDVYFDVLERPDPFFYPHPGEF